MSEIPPFEEVENNTLCVEVLLPLPIDHTFTYRTDEPLQPGQWVRAPFGKKSLIGVVWEKGGRNAKKTPDKAPELLNQKSLNEELVKGKTLSFLPSEHKVKLRPLEKVFASPPLAAVQRDFLEWMAQYTMAARGSVLRLMTPPDVALDPLPQKHLLRLSPDLPPDMRMTPVRQRILAAARDSSFESYSFDSYRALAEKAGVSPTAVKTFWERGGLVKIREARDDFPPPKADYYSPQLSGEQKLAAIRLQDKVKAGGFSTTLLEGVTGSGKTEVYFEAIQSALLKNRQVLILLPEIALSTQWLSRFEARFGVKPAAWHSDIGLAMRKKTWQSVQSAEVTVLVGARSALFLPFPKLGLIIVDEEHEASFKQEDGVLYHARDMAIVRAKFADIPCVLASATPSFETFWNAKSGRYDHLVLSQRFGGAAMPHIDIVDMKRKKDADKDTEQGVMAYASRHSSRHQNADTNKITQKTPALKEVGLKPQARVSARWLMPELVAAIATRLERGEQSLLFLNRRGYAPLTLCRECGHRFGCPDCDTWLVAHKAKGILLCHHCGYRQDLPLSCPACGEADQLYPSGPGVERVAEEVSHVFPDARIAILSSDVVGSKSQLDGMIADIIAGRADIVVGTQMVAKGHHFPNLTLVGVVDADIGLGGGDFRAFEKTYQVLIQVAGRSGRESRPGQMILQTTEPAHPIFQVIARGDGAAFYALEETIRRDAGLPPFGRLASLILSGPLEGPLVDFCTHLARHCPKMHGVEVLGPAPAPLARIRTRYRYRFLVKARRNVPVQSFIQAWLGTIKTPKDIRIAIDIDPYSFL